MAAYIGSYTMNVGDTKELYVSDSMWKTLGYSTTHWGSTTWTSSNTSVISITYKQKGQCTIKAVGNGTAKIEYDVFWADAYLNWIDTKDYYNITVEGGKITITASPNGGSVTKRSKVTLTSSPSGANIYYTLDGSTPTTSSNIYTSTGITITNDCTLKAIAKKNGYKDSDVLTVKYTMAPSDGDIFTAKTAEGVEMNFWVRSVNAKTCEVAPSAIDPNTSGSITIPAEINGFKVIGIQSSAFKECKNITSVTIPSSVTRLGDMPFEYCENLTRVSMTDNVTKIGGWAFKGCLNLNDVNLSKSLTTIEYEMFHGCSKLTAITIPNSVTWIGYKAFKDCSSLTSITIPNSVTSIGHSAFWACSKLREVTLSTSLKTLQDYTFSGCSSIETISGFNNIESIGNSSLPTNSPWYNNLPDGMNFIGKVLLNYKGEMPANTIIEIPEGCTQVYSGISNQSGLVGLRIPSSCVSITTSTNCPNLQTITVDASNSVYDSRNNCNAIIEKATNTLLHGCSNTTIPTNVTSIGSYAFYGNWTKDEILIPNQIDSIASDAFRNCSNVKSILIGKGLRKLGSYAFAQLPRLREIAVSTSNPYFDSRDNCNAIIEKATNALIVGCAGTTIPNSVNTIGSYAYYGNGDEDFTSLVIPNSVEEIKSCAFYDLPYLREVSIGANVKTFGNYMFYKCTSLEAIESLNGFPDDINEKVFDSGDKDFSIYDNVTLYVPAGCRNNYRLATGWSNFKNIVEGSLVVGVDDVLTPQPQEEVIYSPTGVRLAAPQRGVNIVNGRKLLVK